MSAARETIDRIVRLTQQLGVLLSQENKIMAERRPADLEPLYEEKLRLSEIYNAEMAALRQNPELIQGAPSQDIELLKKATFLFNEILQEQRRRFQAAKTVAEGVLKTISDEVSARRQPLQRYGANGTIDRPHPAVGAVASSIALNQVV